MGLTSGRQSARPRYGLGLFARALRTLAIAALALVQIYQVTGDVTLTQLEPKGFRQAVEMGGTVILAVDGTLPLSEALSINRDTTLDATGHFVILDGGQKTRHFVVNGIAKLRLINLTLIDGRFTGDEGAEGSGGSIYSRTAMLELLNCRLISNSVTGGNGPSSTVAIGNANAGGHASGGAIHTSGGIAATNCVFADNQANGGSGTTSASGYGGAGGHASGGAIYSGVGSLILSGVVFSNNVAKAGDNGFGTGLFGGGSAYGGAVAASSGRAVIRQCLFLGNRGLAGSRVDVRQETGVAYGGAVYKGGGAIQVEETFFCGNSAVGGNSGRTSGVPLGGPGNGGALYLESGTLEARSSSIVSNYAVGGPSNSSHPAGPRAGDGSGGGIYSTGDLLVVNCTIAENRALGGNAGASINSGGSAYGGAVFSLGNVSLVNVTIAQNSVRVGTGFEYPGDTKEARGSSIATTNGLFSLTNTILFCLPSDTNVFGTIVDGGHNISSDASPQFSLPSSRSSLNPQLGVLGNYGGPTPTLPLLPYSPAIDAANDSACPSIDQRGVVRPMGLGCDVGAFELAPQLRLTRTASASFKLEYRFQAERANLIMASTNLVDWAVLGKKATDSSGEFIFEDGDSASHLIQFYSVLPEQLE